MYVGHFAIGLALKASFPGIPTLPLLLGVGFLYILDGIFIMLGWDIVTPNFAAGPYLFFDLTFIDWDHSLLAAVVWSVVWACLFWKDRRIAVLAFVASFSHFLADWPMHNNDLALLPHSQTHFGLGLWGRLGTASWVIEGVFVVVLAAYAWNSARKRGVNWIWPLVVLTIAFFNLSPWLSPMKHIAVLDEPAAHLLHGLLVTLGFLLPGALLTWLVNREERKALRLRTR
ncbi:hypothetical protein [Xanthomonas hortorum]|uniref:hypothetical protein n=1 Tax=Xanthomonas hortorum TaxID=56454 RepID=UPI001E430930|nr:hypothetical protein [Xanthomonas hortorum]MCC8554370.1 hypothetical protein [Xanthomonas hortorum pv. gardneri]MCE4364869.1 hypothetical protein [Xanthomonas hortorum]